MVVFRMLLHDGWYLFITYSNITNRKLFNVNKIYEIKETNTNYAVLINM